MPEAHCRRCQSWHEPALPKCTWPVDALCRRCGRAIGFRGGEQPDDGRCARCWCAEDLGIVVRDSVPAVRGGDWLAEFDRDPVIMIGSKRGREVLETPARPLTTNALSEA